MLITFDPDTNGGDGNRNNRNKVGGNIDNINNDRVANFEGRINHKVIVFICSNEEEQKEVLNDTEFCIVGNNLVQRYKTEQKLWITKLDTHEPVLSNESEIG